MEQLQYLKPLQRAEVYFNQKKYEEAIDLFQQYIGHVIHLYPQIDGLGNNQVSIGYYEWNISEWYTSGIKTLDYRGTPFDYLSLSYLSLKGKEDTMFNGIKWYRKNVDRLPEDYRFTFGLANILSNKGYYEEAINYYRQTIQIRPNWIPPYQCIAYIYEYKRIEKVKALQVCNKILSHQPNNRVALFVLARNEKSSDSKIEKLKKVTELHPKYARATNEIGIVYGGSKKMYDQAIEWYKKCTQIAPNYASCYNNIGVNYELKKEYSSAMQWYFQAVNKDRQYKAPHTNLIDVFEALEYSEEKIVEVMKNHSVFHEDYFYYYLGLGYYDKDKNDRSIKFYLKAKESAKDLQKQIHKVYNSMGITYDQLKDYDKAIENYKKCIQACPSYHSAYYNLAIVYKTQNDTDSAILWYKKAIQINPRYSYAYNNLGNIYKHFTNYEQAIKCYKKAVQYLSTYSLALANMGICYLKLKNYREAFDAMSRAKEVLPTDNNNLSQSNKTFLKDTLQNFEKEGETWRQNGVVTEYLKDHLQNYQSKFKTLYSNSEKQPVLLEKTMKPQILALLRLLQEDKFALGNINQICKLVQKLYSDNEEYFHIMPQIFAQYFQKNALQQKKPILELEDKLYDALQAFQQSESFQSMVKNDEVLQQRKVSTSSIKNYNQCQLNNVFHGKPYFQGYQQFMLYIEKAHLVAKSAYSEFKSLVDQTRKKSNGIPYGVCVKLTNNQQERFIATLRMISKVFQAELDRTRIKAIAARIFAAIQQKYTTNNGTVTFEDIEHYSNKIIANEISQILQKRRENEVQTVADFGDFLRGKILFQSIDHIKKAVAVFGEISNNKGYVIRRMQNRLASQTQDFVINVEIKNAICQLRLCMSQNESGHSFLKLLENIEKNPLGCLFGSCNLLFKEVQYSILQNCRDIAQNLAQLNGDQHKNNLSGALYLLNALNSSNLIYK